MRRLLRVKFDLGLFENPYLDVDHAVATVGKEEFRKEGEAAQRKSFTLLSNSNNTLPYKQKEISVYAEGINPATLKSRGFQVVDDPKQADLTILRLKTPSEPRPGKFESLFPMGSLEFPAKELSRLKEVLAASKSSVVDVYLDRPAVLADLVEAANALVVNYGASEDALLDVMTGVSAPEGKLPFDLPRSMEAVVKSRSDVPYDTENPVFKFGHGLSY
jgi:beta-glucosidase